QPRAVYPANSESAEARGTGTVGEASEGEAAAADGEVVSGAAGSATGRGDEAPGAAGLAGPPSMTMPEVACPNRSRNTPGPAPGRSARFSITSPAAWAPPAIGSGSAKEIARPAG